MSIEEFVTGNSKFCPAVEINLTLASLSLALLLKFKVPMAGFGYTLISEGVNVFKTPAGFANLRLSIMAYSPDIPPTLK